MDSTLKRTWAEIDLDALAHNYKTTIKKAITAKQIQYSVSSKFKNAKSMTVPTSKNTKKKISKLKGRSEEV